MDVGCKFQVPYDILTPFLTALHLIFCHVQPFTKRDSEGNLLESDPIPWGDDTLPSGNTSQCILCMKLANEAANLPAGISKVHPALPLSLEGRKRDPLWHPSRILSTSDTLLLHSRLFPLLSRRPMLATNIAR